MTLSSWGVGGNGVGVNGAGVNVGSALVGILHDNIANETTNIADMTFNLFLFMTYSP